VCGGFVTDSSKKTWEKPVVQRFAGPEEAWKHYKETASPEKLEIVRKFLQENSPVDGEWNRLAGVADDPQEESRKKPRFAQRR
jgi:hypothetical protein